MISAILLQAQTLGSTTVDSVADTLHRTATVATASAAPVAKELSLIGLIMKGGPGLLMILIPIALLLLLTIYVIVERILVINRAAHNDQRFMDSIKDSILNGNLDSARALCKNSSSPEARVIEKGISRIGKPMKDIESAMESEGKLQIAMLERRMGVLNIIGRIAPMLGFIGTIMGVIKIFYDISLSNTISIDVIAGGLYQKMITSAAGLMVGVIAFAGYHWLNLIIEKVILRMETGAVRFIDMLQEPTK
jgi:biopolymer transport protein ExbB